MTEAAPSYTFTCPKCGGNFSIELERIPPVKARFRCPSCTQPMDFPSRDEARVYSSLQVKTQTQTPARVRNPAVPPPDPAAAAGDPAGAANPGDSTRFHIEKPGFENDVFDRRGMRALIRTGEVNDRDRVRVNDGGGVAAGDLPYLKSLFALRKTARVTPPACCRTHTDHVAFYLCADSSRPLCEDCAPTKKFGATIIRVCQHCGGTVKDLPQA